MVKEYINDFMLIILVCSFTLFRSPTQTSQIFKTWEVLIHATENYLLSQPIRTTKMVQEKPSNRSRIVGWLL
jgi:hypothetical protein